MPRAPLPLNDKLEKRSPREKRDERDLLGFLRQPAVRWLSPGLLARSGVEVVVSATFGKFADKRELQTQEQGDETPRVQTPQQTRAFDYSAAENADGLWIDYLSDTGDGWDATYTMAWLLAQPELPNDGHGKDEPAALKAGRVLLLGGDQVYPTAEPEAYEDRFIGPFESALPKTDGDVAGKRHMFATPGNHDWYDGLVSFLRVFCSDDGDDRDRDDAASEPRRIGDWVTRQRRSYFALKLPNNWWIWAIDIQLDTYLDSVQLQYFRGLNVTPGDKVILMTAKPAWVKAYERRVEPASWRYLSFFEERVLRARQAHLAMTITGDTHHYARYEPVDEIDEPTRITAGGGGAYLSATHTLKPELKLRSLGRAKEQTVAYTRDEHVYPSSHESKKLSRKIYRLALLNPGFARLVGAIYVALGIGALAALGSGDDTLADATDDGLASFLTGCAGGLTLLVVALLAGALIGATDLVAQPFAGKWSVRATLAARILVGALQTVIHLAIAAAVVWYGLELVGGDVLPVAGILAALGLAGIAFGATLFGLFLFGVHHFRGVKAPEAANQVFTGQSIPHYKNFVRMHFTPDGGLTLYPLGVDRVCTNWTHVPERAPDPKFAPAGPQPVARLVDGPLRFDERGRRIS